MTRPLRALIDTDALAHNLACVRRYAAGTKIMAVVKADGYGHGTARAARALQGADAFGVVTLDEAMELRDAGIRHPICLLEGFFEPGELPELARHGLGAVVHDEHQLEILERARLETPIEVWIKIDTGMHRIGFAPERLGSVLRRIEPLGAVRCIGILSHLACADDTSDPRTSEQLACFVDSCKGFSTARSLANSAGIIAWPQTHFDWVRPGIMLYGASPLSGRTAAELGLRPVMRFESRLIAVKRLGKNDPVGYGGAWICPQDMPVGVVACGYGDGYPRQAPAGTPVLVDGVRVPLIGRVSMDMITVDLRAAPRAAVGAPVVLWGEEPAVDEVAACAGTIAYELLCRVTQRVPRVEVGRGG